MAASAGLPIRRRPLHAARVIPRDRPFVLLDDARAADAAPALLYRDPVETVEAHSPEAVRPLLARLREARAAGLHAAGFLSYEAGAALAARPLPPRALGPLAWFGLFEGRETIAADAVPTLLPDPAGAWLAAVEPAVSRTDYDARIARVLGLIAAGDIYQANLTHQLAVAFTGDPLALYARLRAVSRAGWCAYVDTGATRILSFSPELFFALEGDRLTCRPMKGTARRDPDLARDRALAAALAASEKERAENLMIVDLMRNDLSRVGRDVAVGELFAVESYPTIHQMVSTVTATLEPARDAIDVIEALFPCGSITGAPKQRAMEVIAAVEPSPRGPYCGAIGRIDPNGDAQFNVAIRTLLIEADSAVAIGGAGGGIVADSAAGAEWEEARTKAVFLAPASPRFDLIETMAFDPLAGIALLERHLARMKASAELLHFPFDRHDARNELQAATFRLREARRIRLVLAPSGAIAIEVAPAPAPFVGPVDVAVVPLPVHPSDLRLAHKTSARAFYDDARRAAGTAEVVFVRADGLLTEGSFTSLFVPDRGRLLTPPLAHGLLPGVLRASLIDEGRAVEAPLTRADLAGGFLVGNALRGLMPARVAVAKTSPAPH